MAGGRGKDSELPKVREDFGGNIYRQPKLQDSVKGSTNKRLLYVMHLVFHCELFHKKSFIILLPRQFYHFQDTTCCAEGKLPTSKKS